MAAARSPAYILQQYLVSIGLVKMPPVAAGVIWAAFVGSQPDDSDLCVTLYDSTGLMDGRYMNPGSTIDHPGIQIRVRALDYMTAYNMIALITNTLDVISNVPITLGDGSKFTIKAVNRRGTILSLGEDKERHRQMFVYNATISLA